MQVSEKIERLTKNNYNTWSLVIESALKARNLWKYCEEPLDEAEKLKALSEAEVLKHEEAKTIIYTAIDRTEILKSGVCERAYELWLKIRENHEGAPDDLNNISLSEFLGLKYRKGEPIIEYCGRFENALAKLESTGSEVAKSTQFWVFKNTLPKEIKTFVNYWMLANKKGEINSLISSLKLNFHDDTEDSASGTALYGKQEREEKPSKEKEARSTACSYCHVDGHRWKECRKKKADDKRKKSFAERPNNRRNNRHYNNNNQNSQSKKNSAQHSDTRDNKKNYNRKNRNQGAFLAVFSDNSKPKPSQIEQDRQTQCSDRSVASASSTKSLKLVIKPSHGKRVEAERKAESSTVRSNQRHKEERRRKLTIKLKRNKKDREEKIRNQRRVSNKLVQTNPDAHNYSSMKNEKALHVKNPSDDEVNEDEDDQFTPGRNWWIVDSGASSHMTPEIDSLSEYSEFENPRKITLGDGKSLQAQGKGKLYFKQQRYVGVVNEVLYVPGLRENLFSVSKSLDLGNIVNFYSDRVELSYAGEVNLKGIRAPSGLFALQLTPHVKKEHAAVTLDEWHQRFNHTSSDAIKKLARTNAVQGLKIAHKAKENCENCITGKLTRTSHPARTTIKATKDTAVIHLDTVGPIATESLGGSKYFVLGIEEYSGYKLIDFVASKGEIPDVVKRLINKVELESKRAVKMIQTDNGTEFVNSQLAKFIQNKGIIHERSAAYTPQQNGLVERGNRTIIDKVRTILSESNLKEDLWAEAANTAVYTDNRIGFGKAEDGTKTHYELYWGHKPDVSNLRKFGERAIALKNDTNRNSKFDVKGEEMVFVGYTDRFNTYRLWNEETNSIKITCDCKFPGPRKQGTSAGNKINEDAYMDPELHFLIDNNNNNTNNSTEGDLMTFDESSEEEFETASSNSQSEIETIESSNSTEIYNQDSQVPSVNTSTSSYVPDDGSNLFEPREGELRTRSTRSSKHSSQMPRPAGVPIWFWNNGRESSAFTLDDEPMSLEDAKKREDWPKWQKAMDEEMKALMANNTWKLVNRVPGKKPIKTKWVYTIKLKPDGQIERYKARLVAKGYSQIPNIDYKETFAPVASSTTVRILFALANNFNMNLIQFDVKTAFLNGDLEEELYMEYPDGFNVKGDKICKLEKSLYGLKQAPRQWNKKFHAFLDKFKLNQSAVDKCLYYNDKRSLILAIYVDDGLVASSDEKLSRRLTEELANTFEVKFMACESYLGFHVKRNHKEGTLTLHQSLYVEKVLERFGMKEAKPISTPESTDKEITDTTILTPEYPFKELVGSLLYLVTCTRPDIAHAVSVASRTGQPTMAHWNRLKRILRYLRGTAGLGITFRREETPKLIGYSDADYAEDIPTRHSTSGYVAYYGGGPIAWRCQLQSIVTLSTTEAELVSAVDLVKDLLPIKETLLEIKGMEDKPTEVRIDNISTVKVVNNPESTKRTKHIDVRYRWINEKTEEKKIKPVHVYGTEQAADILTKPLTRVKFEANRTLLAMTMLCVLSIMAGSTESIKFTKVNPLYFRPTEKIYIGGDTEYNLTVIIKNPCKKLFVDLTHGMTSVESVLLKQCYDSYYKTVMAPMQPHAYNKTSFNLTYLDEVELKKWTTLDGYSAPSLTGSDDQSSNTQAMKREKRAVFIPVLLVASGVMIGVAATSVSRIHIQNNAENINLLNKDRNMTREALEEAANVLDQAIVSIQNLYNWGPDIDEKMNPVMYEGKEMKAMVAGRIKFYEQSFNENGRILKDLAKAIANKKISPSLLDLTNETLWEEPASKFSHVYNVTSWIHQDDLHIQLHFNCPIKDEKMAILEAVSIPFYNQTLDAKGNDTVCWNVYSGPKYVLYNTTNDCITDTVTWTEREEFVRSQTCRDKEEEMKNMGIIWREESCTKTPPLIRKRISVYEVNGMQRIYCHPFNITVDGVKHTCPDYPFEIESRKSFDVMNMHHLGRYAEKTMMKDIDYHRSKTVISHMHIGDTKMRVDLSKLLNAQKTFKDKVKSIPESLKLASISWEEVKKNYNPVGFFNDLINNLKDWLENIGYAFAVGFGVMALIAVSPIIQVIILLIHILSVPAKLWYRNFKNLLMKLREHFNWKSLPSRISNKRYSRYAYKVV